MVYLNTILNAYLLFINSLINLLLLLCDNQLQQLKQIINLKKEHHLQINSH